MVFSDKQKSVTQSCAASDDKDYWIIGSEGTRLRPSNWPERIASTFIQMEEFAARKKLVSECVSLKNINSRSCLMVRKKFQQGCGKGWDYVESFAKSNDLSIVDNHGTPYTYSENELTSCSALENALND
jgi:hypothetical protein